MKKFLVIPAVLAVLSSPKAAFASFATSVSGGDVLYVLPFIILIELLAIMVIARAVLKANLRLYTMLVAVFVANVIAAAVGTAVDILLEVSDAYAYVYTTLTPTYSNTAVVWIILAFVLSLLIEWRVYVRFFRRSGLGERNLFRLSLVGNTITYLIIASAQ
jgi:hypothetical protein